MMSMLLGPKEVARRMDIKVRYAYIVMRRMQHVNIANGQKNQKLRVFEEDLDAYIANRTEDPEMAARNAVREDHSNIEKLRSQKAIKEASARTEMLKNGCPKIPRKTK